VTVVMLPVPLFMGAPTAGADTAAPTATVLRVVDGDTYGGLRWSWFGRNVPYREHGPWEATAAARMAAAASRTCRPHSPSWPASAESFSLDVYTADSHRHVLIVGGGTRIRGVLVEGSIPPISIRHRDADPRGIRPALCDFVW